MTKTQRARRLSELRSELELLTLLKRTDYPDWKRAWRARERWAPRFHEWAEDTLADLRRALPDERNLVRLAESERKSARKREREPRGGVDINSLAERISATMQTDPLVEGSLVAYLRVARNAGEDAGQFTLDALGIDKTFSWANPRNMARALYATRGSKIIGLAHGSHIEELASIVARATDPARPLAIDQVTKEIRERWDGLERWQAERIARTETAAVWETTSFNAMRANGVGNFNNLVATGPSIGVTTGAVCPICTEIAANSPWPAGELVDTPPWHPNCRCVLIPAEDFLPPAQTWTGQDIGDLLPTHSDFGE